MYRSGKAALVVFLTLMFWHQAACSQTPDNQGTVLKVLTFNILHGATTKGDFDLDAIAKVIIDAEPDLVALQEVDFRTNRARKYDLVTELGLRTKMASLFGKAMDFDGGQYGEGILSNHTFIKTRNVPLPFSPGNEPRTALEVMIALPSGDTIVFIGTHLDHLKDPTDRIAQVKKINEVFSGNQYPTILAGDLNAVPGSEPINLLETIWTPTYSKSQPQPTFPSDNPRVKIDYILFIPKHRWRVLHTEVIQDPVSSDHCAYLVTLKLQK